MRALVVLAALAGIARADAPRPFMVFEYGPGYGKVWRHRACVGCPPDVSGTAYLLRAAFVVPHGFDAGVEGVGTDAEQFAGISLRWHPVWLFSLSVAAGASQYEADDGDGTLLGGWSPAAMAGAELILLSHRGLAVGVYARATEASGARNDQTHNLVPLVMGGVLLTVDVERGE